MTDDQIRAFFAGRPVPKTLLADYRPAPAYTPRERKQLEDWLKLGPPWREFATLALAAEPPTSDVKN